MDKHIHVHLHRRPVRDAAWDISISYRNPDKFKGRLTENQRIHAPSKEVAVAHVTRGVEARGGSDIKIVTADPVKGARDASNQKEFHSEREAHDYADRLERRPNVRKINIKGHGTEWYVVWEERAGDALNHLGEREYQTWGAWRAAAKAAGATRFEGNSDIASAINSEGKHVGEWGGDKGSIYKP